MPLDPHAKPPSSILRPRDQGPVALAMACALALMAMMWLKHGGPQGRLIDVDRAEPLAAKFQVDVNQADWPELTQLPGIGDTLAMRLINEREQHGRFRNADDLSRVGGIGPRTLERIRPYIAPIPSDAGIAQR